MKMTTRFIATILFSLFYHYDCIGQSKYEQFKKLVENEDTAGQRKLLEKWETTDAKDPDLFIAYFNYYVKKSRLELIAIDNNPKAGESLVVTDPVSGKPVGFMNASIHFKSDILQKGFDYIDKGIALHPTRLDMRFGKIYMLGQAENYLFFSKEIVAAIHYSNTINNAWLWKNAQPLEDSKEFFVGSIQDYITTIYQTENDDLLPLMRDISHAMLKYHPGHVESLSNVALTYILIKEYDEAIPYLLKAETVAPKDIIVLNNIAEIYKRKNDKPNAKLYLQKIIKFGNADEIKDAQQRLLELEKN